VRTVINADYYVVSTANSRNETALDHTPAANRFPILRCVAIHMSTDNEMATSDDRVYCTGLCCYCAIVRNISLYEHLAFLGLSDRDKRRQLAIQEFVETEEAYIHALQLVIELFFEPVRNANVLNTEEWTLMTSSWRRVLETGGNAQLLA
jgi:hypothetical protein